MTMNSIIRRHMLREPYDEYGITNVWIQTELERANKSLNQIHILLSRNGPGPGPNRIDEKQERTTGSNTSIPMIEQLKRNDSLAKLSRRLDYLDISFRYLEAMKIANGSADIQDLVHLGMQLLSILQDYHYQKQPDSEIQSEITSLLHQIDTKVQDILLHIRARCILFLRKMLTKHSFPNPTATDFLIDEMAFTKSGLSIHIHSLKQVDDGNNINIARELLRPIVSRIEYHFLKSQTVPQTKIDKLPHVLLEYVCNILEHVIPVFKAFHVTNDALALVYSLIQHVLFRRGYYEIFSNINLHMDVVKLCRWIEDILLRSQQIYNLCHDENKVDNDDDDVHDDSLLTSSLFQVLVGQNEEIWEWWLNYESEQAKFVLARASSAKEMMSCRESFESLIYSFDKKVEFIPDAVLNSTFANQVVIPSCMNYMDILGGKGKSLKRIMKSPMSSMESLAFTLHEWMNLIDITEAAIRLLDSSKCTKGVKSFVSSFQKLSDGIADECTKCYLDLLLERSPFSSFLMTASYLIEHGIESSSSESFMGVFSAWRNIQGTKKDLICHKIGQVVSEQMLTIVLDDETLKLSPKGCREFSRISLDIFEVLSCGGIDVQGDLQRLKDVAIFLRDESSDFKMKHLLYNFLEKDLNAKLSIDELESDGTIYEEVQMMIRSKFTAMTIHDALNLLNRLDDTP